MSDRPQEEPTNEVGVRNAPLSQKLPGYTIVTIGVALIVFLGGLRVFGQMSVSGPVAYAILVFASLAIGAAVAVAANNQTIMHTAEVHSAHVVKNMPRRTPRALALAGATWGALAALMVVMAVTSRGNTDIDSRFVFDFALLAVGLAAISAYFFWRLARFRIAEEATEVEGSLALTAPRWSVRFQHGDVKQVRQMRRNPYGGGRYDSDNAAWGAWLRIDASAGGTRVRRYLVWRPDAVAFLEQLQRDGFPVVGEVIPVPLEQDPST